MLSGDPNTAYEQLRDAQENLFNRYILHIEHYGPNGQKVEVIKMRWISSISYKDGDGEVALAFAPGDCAVPCAAEEAIHELPALEGRGAPIDL